MVREENEQNMQVMGFKMEQIAVMQQATQEIEEKLTAVTSELEKEKNEKKQQMEKIKELTQKCKLLKAKNEKLKSGSVKEEKLTI